MIGGTTHTATTSRLSVADGRRYDSYCDYRKVNRDEEEEEEDTFSCLKSPETSGGFLYVSVPLFHQAANLVSKPVWVCKSTKVRIFFQQKVPVH